MIVKQKTFAVIDAKDVLVEIQVSVGEDNSVGSNISCYITDKYDNKEQTWKNIILPRERLNRLVWEVVNFIANEDGERK